MALVAAPNNVSMVFRISPVGKLEQMTGEIGIAGVSGCGSGTVAVVNSTGAVMTGAQPNVVAAAVAALLDGQLTPGNPPYLYQSRWVVDLATSTVNTF